MEIEGLQEYIIIHNAPAPATSTATASPLNEVKVWTQNTTLSLLDGYKQHRSKVGSLQMKSFKKLWELLATEVNKVHNTNFTSGHCENRWRVVERNYKKFVDNSNKTGRGRREFEYEVEMNAIFGKKKNMHPELLLSTNSIDKDKSVKKSNKSSDLEPVLNVDEELMSPQQQIMAPAEEETPNAASSKTPRRRRYKAPTRNCTLDLLRIDKKIHYEGMRRIHEERLIFERQKFADNTEMKRRRVEAIEQGNKLLTERNELLQKYLDQGVVFPFPADM